MSYPCPFCRTPADPATGCPGCGRGPDPDAAEVVRLDAEIPVLTVRLREAHEAVAAAGARLRDAWQRRNAAAARVRAALSATDSAPAVPPPARPGADRTPEASTRLVQNVLFLLGGLLLAVAAVVFTAVAWSQFGVGGRAALLAVFTAAALAVPPLALRRGLGATAETFAAVGLLLVLLDGYAAWYVNLFGVADSDPSGYAGAVFAITAAVAVGYETVTGLTGPRFAALLAAQPVLPLLAAPFEPDATGWAATLAAVAILDLVVLHLHRDRTGQVPAALRICASVLGGAALLGTGVCTLAVLAMTSGPGEAARAGAVLVAGALVAVAAAVSARAPRVQAVAGGALVVTVALAAARVVSLVGGTTGPVLVAAVAAGLAGVVAGTARWLPVAVRRGPWVGALAAVGVPLLGATSEAIVAAGASVLAARPVFAAGWGVPAGDLGPQTTAMLALLTAGLAVLLPRTRRPDVAIGGAALMAFAAPAGLHLPWWSAAGFDLVVTGAALVVALRVAARPMVPVAVAVVLTGHAVAVGLGRPGVAAATLAAVVLLGTGTTVAAGSGPRRTIGGFALAVALLAVPAMLWCAGAEAGLTDRWQSRVALGAIALPLAVLAAVARRRPGHRWPGHRWPDHRWYALAAVVAAVVSAPGWAVWSGDPAAVYAAVALLVIASSWACVTVPPGAGPDRWVAGVARWVAGAAMVPGTALVAAVAGSGWAVFVAPYGWLARVWDGRPSGVGVDPSGAGRVFVGDAVAVTVLAVAVAVLGYAVRRRGVRVALGTAVPVVAVALPIWLAALGARWPVVPMASLVAGAAGALAVAVALGRAAQRRPDPVIRLAVAASLAGAGLAGALPTHASTLVALAVTGVAGAAAGAAGRTVPARVAGWLAAVATAVLFAVTAGRAFDLTFAGAAFGVLAVSAAALALGAALTGRRPVEGAAVQAAAQAGAVAALLLTVGSVRYAAAVCTLWGLVLGVRALRPGETAGRRGALVVAAAGTELLAWWLLVAAERVSLAEAYTLPAAAVALLAGRLAVRSRPGLTSWVAYGPALAAALLPSLASVLVGDGQPVRRLILGAGALLVVLAGAYTRLQAPVVTGGVVLVAVALHEVVLVWDLLPRWVPLAAGGLLLVGLAMTLERRRRDLARVRAAVARLG